MISRLQTLALGDPAIKRHPSFWVLISIIALLVLSLGHTQSLAQTAAPPQNPAVDPHNVNLPTGEVIVQRPGVSIGPGGHHGLSFSQTWVNDGWRHNELPTLVGSSNVAVVSFLGSTTAFESDGSGGYTPIFESGATLEEDPNSSTGYVFTSSSGVEISFLGLYNSETFLPGDSGWGGALSIRFTDGVEWTYHYATESYVDAGSIFSHRRLESITSNTGYQIKLDYLTDAISASTWEDWHELTSATAINNAVEYCDPTGDCSSLTGNWPTVTYASGDVTDPAGDTTDYIYAGPGGRISAIRRPGATSDTVSFNYDPSDYRVSDVTTFGETWEYDYTSTRTTVTNPRQGVSWVEYNNDDQLTARKVDAQRTDFSYCDGTVTTCPEGLLEEVETPDGRITTYAYDTRGNVTSVSAAPSGGGTAITQSASFPVSCTNPVICNRPITTTDTAGNVTNFTYDSNHGGVTQVESPPANSGDPRATTIIEYDTNAQARYLSGPGTYTNSANITVPVRSRRCLTAATCSNTVNEAVTETAYPSASTTNNLLPVSVTSRLGDNTEVATSSFTYTDLGRSESVDGPLTGNQDTSYTVYDQYGRMEGSVSADPDGTGSQPRLASRMFYQDGLVIAQESGTTTTTDLSAFMADQRQEIEHDDFGRPVTQRHIVPGGTTQHSVMQVSYNNLGLVECQAVRLNAASTASVLPEACAQISMGVLASDRIGKTIYDNYGRVIEVHSGVGTTLEQVTQEILYYAGASQNGRIARVWDAEGNQTRYFYDDFARHYRTRYPHPTNTGASNNADYDEVTFDSIGRITSFRTRGGDVFTFTHDDIGRIIEIDDPGRTGLDTTHSRNIFYGYDLLGNMEYAYFDCRPGESCGTQEGITNTYNALGQLLATTNDMDGVSRTLSYEHDEARRRTQITHPDNVRFIYGFDVLNRLTNLHRNGQADLLNWTYDDQGRLATRDADYYGPDATYGYDAAGRLDSLAYDHPTNNTYDLSYDVTFNQAGQVTSEAQPNDVFAFGNHLDFDIDFTANGLNQYTSVDDVVSSTPVPHGYDAAGNLTSSGDTVWTYDNANRLVEAADAATGTEVTTLRYDPLGRLYEVAYDADTTSGVGPDTVRRLIYDGHDLVLEYGSTGDETDIMDRYVHGLSPGDDPLIAYDGDSTTRGNADYLIADRTGSIVLVANRNANSMEPNAYDEFGVPDEHNVGRFQFTGQQWVPELGMYYYKARMYSPTLGRFMQTDPIGYGDGLNMYAYVQNDPVNAVDPTGTVALPPGVDSVCKAPGTICDPAPGWANNRAYMQFMFGIDIGPDPFGKSQDGEWPLRPCAWAPIDSSDRRRIDRALRSPAVQERLRAMQRQSNNTGNEHLFYIYFQEGSIGVTPLIEGETDDTGPLAQYLQERYTRDYGSENLIRVHSHPTEPFPSRQDARTAQRTGILSLIQGPDGAISGGRRCQD